jgi:capsular exopolysaccharide synthesis family protein
VLVTSPVEGEGKTSISVNLGVSLAQQRLRVLLVDCDLHGARLHRIFQLPQAPGLSQVLLEDALPREVLRATPISGLFVITAGTLPESPADAIGSPRMRAMLNDLVRDFDVVILDSSPVLAVSDSSILSAAADAVLIVVRAGKSSPTDIAEAGRQLSAVGARVAGAVLNDPDGRVPQYGGYAYGYPRG